MDAIIDRLYETISSNVDEIGVVFSESIDLVVEEGKLGIPVKILIQLKQHLKTYPDCDKKWFARLICSGDDYTAWARRKLLLTTGESSIGFEMRVVDLILSKQPKSGGAWEHRRFIVERALKNSKSVTGVNSLIKREIEICERVCERHPRTYYAYSHRVWCVSWMSPQLLEEEIQITKNWILRHISDGSASTHLSLLLNLLFERSAAYSLNLGNRIRYVVNELKWCSELSLKYLGHESLWLYRRALNQKLLHLFLELSMAEQILINKALSIVDLDAKLEESKRFNSYNWWVSNNGSFLPNLEDVIQVCFDELAYSIRLGLDEEISELMNTKKSVLLQKKFALSFCRWLVRAMEKILFPAFKEVVRRSQLDYQLENFDKKSMPEEVVSKEESAEILCKLFETLDVDFVIKKIFDTFDVGTTGEVTKQQLMCSAIVFLGIHGTKMAENSFHILDVDKDSKLSRSEFQLYVEALLRLGTERNHRSEQELKLDVEEELNHAMDLAKDKVGLSFDEFQTWIKLHKLGRFETTIQVYERLLRKTRALVNKA